MRFDARTKEGRELRELISETLDLQSQHEAILIEVKEATARGKRLEKETGTKLALIEKQMQKLGTDLVEVADVAAALERVKAHARPAHAYKDLYFEALGKLREFNAEAADAIEAAAEVAIEAKRAEMKTAVSVRRTQESVFRRGFDVLAGLWEKFTSSFRRATAAADEFVTLADAIVA